ncbi:threonylcarbamoyl-AMP synthase [Candidatus Woesearchaeota archaeon]|nr:threonylcarbamoyl-AMP synthase [Candidatus Woesearchaeota archaeon]
MLKINRNAIDLQLIKRAAKVLRGGGLVAFPTETVYGLGANALDAKAVAKIFKAKGRPSDNPIIVHVSNLKQLRDIVKGIPQSAKPLMRRYWPGPLTLIFRKAQKVPDEVTAGLPTVAVRMPSHPVALALIDEAGVPVAAPSANLSGRPSPTTAEHVIEDLNGRVEVIIDSGSTDIGVESTVLDITKSPFTILRPGGVSLESLSQHTQVRLHPKLKDMEMEADEIPESPGMKYRHYAPKAKLIVLKGAKEKISNAIKELVHQFRLQGLRVGVLAPFSGRYGANVTITCDGDKLRFANILFKALRKFDEEQVDIILVAGVKAAGIGRAIMNRLEKAAVYKVIEL